LAGIGVTPIPTVIVWMEEDVLDILLFGYVIT
jgi:hypothetical protein